MPREGSAGPIAAVRVRSGCGSSADPQDVASREQVREFKEAFGFFNSQNPADTELTADEIFEVMTRFEPHKEVDIKVRAGRIVLPVSPRLTSR